MCFQISARARGHMDPIGPTQCGPSPAIVDLYFFLVAQSPIVPTYFLTPLFFNPVDYLHDGVYYYYYYYFIIIF